MNSEIFLQKKKKKKEKKITQIQTSQEIEPKLNETRLLKFYQVKQLKKNSTENSAEKNFKEDLQLNELWNICTKKEEKKKRKKNT